MSDFWILAAKDGSDRKLADWAGREKTRFENLICTLDPRHSCLGKRLSPLDLALPDIDPEDFVWTHLNELVVRETVVHFLKEYGFSGFKAAPIRAEFRTLKKSPPTMFEIIVTGSGGLADPTSGVRAVTRCAGCTWAEYSAVKFPERLVNELSWDGSDLFEITPLEGRIFITARLKNALLEKRFTGWQPNSLSEMKDNFNIAIGGTSNEITAH